MAQLVALLSTGKETWTEVAQIINKPEFDEIYILTNAFSKDKFTNLPSKKVEVMVFDFDNSDAAKLTTDFASALKGKLQFTDVAVNMSSGSGKEHMALFAAMIKIGVGIRLVALINGEVKEI
jgi:hypothetical protein